MGDNPAGYGTPKEKSSGNGVTGDQSTFASNEDRSIGRTEDLVAISEQPAGNVTTLLNARGKEPGFPEPSLQVPRRGLSHHGVFATKRQGYLATGSRFGASYRVCDHGVVSGEGKRLQDVGIQRQSLAEPKGDK